MATTSPRRHLTRADWVGAGLQALAEGGPDAVAVEPVAARLGATKGSGYWHWTNRAELLAAVLETWREVATEQVIERLEATGADAGGRLSALLTLVIENVRARPGELATIGHADPAVRAVVEQITGRRVAYVAQLLAELGFDPDEAQRRAVLGYSAYLGYAQLTAIVPGRLPTAPEERRALQLSLVAMITARQEPAD